MSEVQEESVNIAASNLSTFIKSEEYLEKELKTYDDFALKKLYNDLLDALYDALKFGDINILKELIILVKCIRRLQDNGSLSCYCNYENRGTNIFILASKIRNSTIFEHLFSNDCTLIEDLSRVANKSVSSLFCQEDYESHNIFYYAMRTNKFKNIGNLVNKWHSLLSSEHQKELDNLLSHAYHELKWKNVDLSTSVQVVIEQAILDLRFVPNSSKETSEDLNSIKERMTLVIGIIEELELSYHDKTIDTVFILKAKFIAKNIFILKCRLKSTYDRIPWEEIEFCLLAFIYSLTRSTNVDLHYRQELKKISVLKYLKHFALILKEVQTKILKKDIDNTIIIMKRDEAVKNIIANCPEFTGMYRVFRTIRNVRSLQTIRVYLQLAIRANPSYKEGQLLILRAVHVLSECLRNTLEAPNMSPYIAEILLFSMTRKNRNTVLDMRNSLSPIFSLKLKFTLEYNAELSFYFAMKNDLENVLNIVEDMFFHSNLQIMKNLLVPIFISENNEKLQTAIEEIYRMNLQDLFSIMENECKVKKHTEFKDVFLCMIRMIENITPYENDLFNDLQEHINLFDSEVLESIFSLFVQLLKKIQYCQISKSENQNVGMQFFASAANDQITSIILNSEKLEKMSNISLTILESISQRLLYEKFDKVQALFVRFSFLVRSKIIRVYWLEELREKLDPVYSDLLKMQQKYVKSVCDKFLDSQMNNKLSSLRDIFSTKSSSDQKFHVQFSFYTSNKLLLTNIETLVLDILSVLHTPDHKNFIDNVNFMDMKIPVLIGHSLWYYLTYKDIIFETLPCDVTNAIILNALNIINSKNDRRFKMEKRYSTDLNELKLSYEKDLFLTDVQEKLYASLESGNIELVKSYVKKGADIYAKNINHWSSLHFAAKGPDVKIVKILVDFRVDVHAVNMEGKNALHIAAAFGRIQNIKCLLESGLEINARDRFGCTPLHLAVKNKHSETVSVLLECGADMKALDFFGSSPMHFAIWSKSLDTIKILFTKATDYFDLLHHAVEVGHIDTVNYLLQEKLNINGKNDNGMAPLHIAILNKDLEVVRALIAKKCNINQRNNNGFTPLLCAAEISHEDIIKILLENGAQVNVCCRPLNVSPIHYAAMYGTVEVLKILLHYKAEVNVKTIYGKYPLHYAAQEGFLDVAKLLIANKGQVNAKDNGGDTVLHVAASFGHVNLTKYFIQQGGKVNIRNRKGQTALHAAAEFGTKEVIEILLKEGAAVNAVDECNYMPLHLSLKSNHSEVVEVLLANGAKVNERIKACNWTPLHIAVGSHYLEKIRVYSDIFSFSFQGKDTQQNSRKVTAKLVIDAGANVHARNDLNLNSLHIATILGDSGLAELLIASGIQIDSKDAKNAFPLFYAVTYGHTDLVKILVENGATIDLKGPDDITPLTVAVRKECLKIVEILMEAGADITVNNYKPLYIALSCGFEKIFNELLKYKKLRMNNLMKGNITILHLAAKLGNAGIVKALVKKGVDVNVPSGCDTTPLHLAIESGNKEIVEILIRNGANVNKKCSAGLSPLHSAATAGYVEIVDLLINYKANVYNVTTNENILYSAVSEGHITVVERLLRHENFKINNTFMPYKLPLLHVAARNGDLGIVQILVDKGANVRALDYKGLMAIHMAITGGYIDIVSYFLACGCTIHDLSLNGYTLLHYAVISNKYELVKLFISKGVNINAGDTRGLLPIHHAATKNLPSIVRLLMKSGSIYNISNAAGLVPCELTEVCEISNLFMTTDRLFTAIKKNDINGVEQSIKDGASINAFDRDYVSPLHRACWKGYENIVEVLLKNNANPNACGKGGTSPLHYAAKFGHIKVVKLLLLNSAIFNVPAINGKTPLEFTCNSDIIKLLKFINNAFNNVRNRDLCVIEDLKSLTDVETLNTVTSAKNKDQQTLIMAATQSKFPKLEEMKTIVLKNFDTKLKICMTNLKNGKTDDLLTVFSILKSRTAIVGTDNLDVLEISSYVANLLFEQSWFKEAEFVYRDILYTQHENHGVNDPSVLATKSKIGLILQKLGDYDDSAQILQEAADSQRKILTTNHQDTLDTLQNLAITLLKMKKYEEALDINYEVLQNRKALHGEHHILTFDSYDGIASIKLGQGKKTEALEIYRQVLNEKCKFLGCRHLGTLMTMHSIGSILYEQKKLDEALLMCKDILKEQIPLLGEYHFDNINTQFFMATILFKQQNLNEAQEICECIIKKKDFLGYEHKAVTSAEELFADITRILQ